MAIDIDVPTYEPNMVILAIMQDQPLPIAAFTPMSFNEAAYHEAMVSAQKAYTELVALHHLLSGELIELAILATPPYKQAAHLQNTSQVVNDLVMQVETNQLPDPL